MTLLQRIRGILTTDPHIAALCATRTTYAPGMVRDPRPAIDWRSICTSAALALASAALVWAGATLVGVGEVRLGWGMIGAGVVVLVLSSQVEW